jgi:D-aminopeptidase
LVGLLKDHAVAVLVSERHAHNGTAVHHVPGLNWVLREHGHDITSINPVAGEINDSWLTSTNRRPVTADHVLSALDSASSEPVPMGNVGGGTGACALGFKGGIGSSSRKVDATGGAMTVGALVQINMDGDLRALGQTVTPADLGLPISGPRTADGSCVIVVGVDAPLDSNTLRRMAARAVFALARVGARFSHGSGDYGLAFSSVPAEVPSALSNAATSALFESTMDAVEEAVIDALLAADSVSSSNGNHAFALPAEAIGVRT